MPSTDASVEIHGRQRRQEVESEDALKEERFPRHWRRHHPRGQELDWEVNEGDVPSRRQCLWQLQATRRQRRTPGKQWQARVDGRRKWLKGSQNRTVIGAHSDGGVAERRGS